MYQIIFLEFQGPDCSENLPIRIWRLCQVKMMMIYLMSFDYDNDNYSYKVITIIMRSWSHDKDLPGILDNDDILSGDHGDIRW